MQKIWQKQWRFCKLFQVNDTAFVVQPGQLTRCVIIESSLPELRKVGLVAAQGRTTLAMLFSKKGLLHEAHYWTITL